MGGALATAVIKKIGGEKVCLTDNFKEKAIEIAGNSGAEVTDIKALCDKSKFIFIGVKPQVIAETFDEIKDVLLGRNNDFVIVSMAAGVCIERICAMVGKKVPVIRIMPNTSVSVGAGMTVYSANDLVKNEDVCEFEELLSFSGKLLSIDEELIDAAMAVSGCGPAYIYLTIRALANGGENCGLSKETALLLAEQTVLGAAKLAIESGKDPKQLETDVCSPGGATIEGIYLLENEKVPDAFASAVKAAYDKAKKL